MSFSWWHVEWKGLKKAYSRASERRFFSLMREEWSHGMLICTSNSLSTFIVPKLKVPSNHSLLPRYRSTQTTQVCQLNNFHSLASSGPCAVALPTLKRSDCFLSTQAHCFPSHLSRRTDSGVNILWTDHPRRPSTINFSFAFLVINSHVFWSTTSHQQLKRELSFF